MSNTVGDVLRALQLIAPSEMAFGFDRIGLQVGDPSQTVTLGVVTMDASMAAIRHAKAVGAQVLVSHHPVIWEPLRNVLATGPNARVWELARSGLSSIAAHTNWDSCPGGLNDFLAEQIGLQDVRSFGSSAEATHLKVVVFVPTAESDGMLTALAAAGAGTMGRYDQCAFSVEGTGMFRPLAGANPTIGKVGHRESVAESRLEMMLPVAARAKVEAALLAAHSYETPAYEFIPLACTSVQPIGRTGRLPQPLGLLEFRALLDTKLHTRAMVWGSTTKPIQTVAVVGGAADDEWLAAQAAGADILVTGEVKQHVALAASESEFAIAAAGHYATEHPSCERLRAKLEAEMPAVKWELFVPPAGSAGRPY
ncbi:MAG: Nif3-like dinuclear metal center hexameric protein [Chthonomonas sp.]|nr:Nif3-like dinuclear metal center hexameric protein [Chthonomonas sp.]